jgi:hypothetical protein
MVAEVVNINPILDDAQLLRNIATKIEEGEYVCNQFALVMNTPEGIQVFGSGKVNEECGIQLFERGKQCLIRMLDD